jgi:hypothetical protein
MLTKAAVYCSPGRTTGGGREGNIDGAGRAGKPSLHAISKDNDKVEEDEIEEDV